MYMYLVVEPSLDKNEAVWCKKKDRKSKVRGGAKEFKWLPRQVLQPQIR
jgi:hypothetical protein